MPGVKVTTSVRTGPSNPPGPETARYFIAGVTERGPVGVATKVASIAQYDATFGGRTPYSSAMFDDAQMYFEEGGTELFVCRAVGPGAAIGSVTLLDNAGAAKPTLRVEALNPGGWSAALTVTVTAGTAPTSSTITVALGGKTVETVKNLTAPADFAAAFAGSKYVKVTNLGSTTAAPANRPAPVVGVLAGGNDDRANITTTHVLAALNSAGEGLGTGAVATPGYTADVIGAGLIAHAVARHRIALLHADSDSDTSELGAIVAALDIDGSDHAGLFHPWLVVPDGSGTRTVQPTGYVAAVRSRAHTLTGFWQVPAGQRAAAAWVLGTSGDLDQTANDSLAASRVSGITRSANTTRLYGWYSLSDDPEFLLLSNRDSLNALGAAISQALDPFVWETVDGRGQLLSRVDGVVRGILQPIADAGGVFARLDDVGAQLDPGYSVQVDTATTTADLLNNEIRVNVGARFSPAAALIHVSIVKAALTAAV